MRERVGMNGISTWLEAVSRLQGALLNTVIPQSLQRLLVQGPGRGVNEEWHDCMTARRVIFPGLNASVYDLRVTRSVFDSLEWFLIVADM